jgi:hypothetical protein
MIIGFFALPETTTGAAREAFGLLLAALQQSALSPPATSRQRVAEKLTMRPPGA